MLIFKILITLRIHPKNLNMINLKKTVLASLFLVSSAFAQDRGLKVLLTDKENLRKQVTNYLEIFKSHPYVFNLGHGILPETQIEMVQELVKIVREYK